MKMFFQENALSEAVVERVKNESHTRLYLAAMNILRELESNIKNDNYDSSYYTNRFVEFLKIYPDRSNDRNYEGYEK